MPICTPIAANILNECDANLITGVNDTIILLPFDDVDKTLSTFDVSNKSLITNLVMKAGKKGYVVEGKNFSNDVDTAMVKGKYQSEFEHNIMFRIFKIDAVTKSWIHTLANNRIMVVVNNNVISGKEANRYEIFGWDQGLELNELTRNQSDSETKGAYVLKMGCDETNKESRLPATVFKTDVATTATMIAALYTI